MSQPFIHSGLGVSVDVPEGWSVEATATFPVQLFAPVRDGYRSNLMFSLERFAPPTPTGAAAFLARVRQDQPREYLDFERLDDEEGILDGHPAVVMHYRWRPDRAMPEMLQLLAFVVIEPGLFLQLDGATTADLAPQMLPALDALLETVRIIHRRSKGAADTD